jgi:outer membrane protein assembly factor BamD (BamD/ComL family)
VKKLVVLLMLFVAAGGCQLIGIHPSERTDPEDDFQHAATLMKSGNYQEAQSLYRRIITTSPLSPVAADAEYESAYLYVYADNPAKDYTLAVAGFEDFIKHHPNHLKIRDARNWAAALKAIVEAGKENEKLKKNIEQLKKLDIRHEERRRK